MSGTRTTIPTRQLPTSCHVCGEPGSYQPRTCTPCEQYAEPCGSHPDRPLCSHDLTNAEAFAAAAEHDRRTTVTYSNGASTPEGNAVAQFAPEAMTR